MAINSITSRESRLIAVVTLTTSFFLVEIIVGYMTNSMALIADSFHMLADCAALVISFLSLKMSPRKWSKNTFGWARAEILGALINAVFLLSICMSITIGSIKRFIAKEEISDPKLLAAVGVFGLLINITGLFLLYDDGHDCHSHHFHFIQNGHCVKARKQLSNNDHEKRTSSCGRYNNASYLNMRGAFLHILGDALGSVIVIISALVTWLTEWEYRFYMDPALSLISVLLIILSVWPLFLESALILLQTVPVHIRIDAIQKGLLEKVEDVLEVHEFHVWQLTGNRIIASAHITCKNLANYMKIAENVKIFFHNEGIHSTTIQPEFIEEDSVNNYETLLRNGTENGCAFGCPPSDVPCVDATCCQKSNKTVHIFNGLKVEPSAREIIESAV